MNCLQTTNGTIETEVDFHWEKERQSVVTDFI